MLLGTEALMALSENINKFINLQDLLLSFDNLLDKPITGFNFKMMNW